MKAKSAKNNNPTMKKGGSKKEDSKVSHVDAALVEKAVSALTKYHNDKVAKKEEGSSSLSLLGNDRAVQVQFGLEVTPGKSRKVLRLDIPNPIQQTASSNENGENEGLDEPDVCLIVKDESKPWIQQMVEEYSELMGCVKKVLTLDSLRKKHARFQQRRELLQKYDVFMADDRILPMLTSVLGKDFIKAKKLPLPLTITRKVALPFAIQRNLASTYMTISQGTSIMIRAGSTGMPEKKLVENIIAIAENAVGKIPRKWANIRNIAIKTPESASLPFYNKLPEELVEIAKLAGIAPAFKPFPDDDNADGNDKDDNDSPKRKRDLAAKSPLVQALKKQKKEAKKDDEKKKKSEERDTVPSEGKKRKKKSNKDNNVADEDVGPKPSSNSGEKEGKESQSEEKSEKHESTKSSQSKKKRKEAESEAAPKKIESRKSPKVVKDEKVEFVASKKFKGSKEGYVFRRGNQGVGYYVDKKPVVDKMMLEALTRASAQGGGKGGRSSKSGGKRKGRR